MRRATDDRNQIRPRGRNIWADVKNEIPRIAAELYAGYPLLISYKILGQAGYIYIYNATCDDSGSLPRTYLSSIPLSVSVFTFLNAFNTRTLYREGKFLITVVYILIARISRIR